MYNGDLDCEFRKYELFQGKYKGFRDEGNALKKDFAPLKRKSRLTGADGEQRPSRKEREADNFSSEIDSESMRRRRELESYFDTYKSRKATQRKKNDDERRESLRTDEKPRRFNDSRTSKPRRFDGEGAESRPARENRRKDDSRKPYARGGKPERKDGGRKQGDFKPLRGGKRVKK